MYREYNVLKETTQNFEARYLQEESMRKTVEQNLYELQSVNSVVIE